MIQCLLDLVSLFPLPNRLRVVESSSSSESEHSDSDDSSSDSSDEGESSTGESPLNPLTESGIVNSNAPVEEVTSFASGPSQDVSILADASDPS